MRNVTRIRFAAAALLFTISCFAMLARAAFAACAGFYIVGLLVPDDVLDLSDSAMRRWLCGVGLRLAVVTVLLGMIWFHPLVSADTMQRISFHPAFVLPVWLLGLWSLFRRWRKQRWMVLALSLQPAPR